MLSQFIRQFISSIAIFFRMIRAFFSQKLMAVSVYTRRLTNFSRYAGKVAVGSFQGLTNAVKKPTKREDYIETRRMFISKSFLVFIAVGLVALFILFYFVVWPFLLSHFFVAKFYQEDTDIETWTGRVILYYDREKTMPHFEGKLEEGLLQGKGTEYDRKGLVSYDGEFVDNLYGGKGESYQDGILLYEGQYEAGLYNGKGRYYQDGILYYTGSFSEGQFEGNGVCYYPSGERHYVGNYAAGLLEGQGTEYREDGSLLYKGAFAAGVYEGDGIYYYSKSNFVKATFEAGVTGGEIKWYQDGKLWYDGGAVNLTPNGFGTVYAPSGKAIYIGEMDTGTINGAALLGLTDDEVREIFGEARVSEKPRSRGFQIVNLTFGLTVLCNYQGDDDEPRVFKVFFQPEGVDATLLPWQDSNSLTRWATTGREEQPAVSGLYGQAAGPNGLLNGSWNQSKYAYTDYFCIMLWKNEHGTPVQLTWGSRSNIPDSGMGTADGAVDQAQERLDGLMEELDGVIEGKPDEESTAAVSGMIVAAEGAESAEALVSALADCYLYTGRTAALESGRAILEAQLSDANLALKQGTGSQDTVDAVKEKLSAMDRTLAQYETGAKQAQMTAKYYCGETPDPAKLQSALVAFDPTVLKAADLCDAAVQYAKAVAADGGEVDAGELTLKVKTALLDLNVAYEDYTAARESVNKAAAAVETKSTAYSQGTVNKNDLYEAQLAQNTAVDALYAALGIFTHEAAALNTLTGGKISQEQKWMSDAFAGVFAAEIEAAKQAAAEQAAEQAEPSPEADAA